MSYYAEIRHGQAEDLTLSALEAVRLLPTHAEFASIEDIRKAVAFRHIAVSGLQIQGKAAGTGTILLSDFPEAFLAEYFAGHFTSIDPLAKQFASGQAISRDSDVFAEYEVRANAFEILDLLRRHGIAERTAIRIDYPSGYCGSVTVISDAPLDKQACRLLRHVAMSLHRDVASPILDAFNSQLRLTKGEIYCLEKVASGLTSQQISLEKVYAVETINTYLKSAAHKLRASNRTHAVAEAFRRRLIS